MKSAASSSTRERRQYRLGKRAAAAEATRNEILSAARSLVSTRGFGNLTIDAVAAEAGVSRLTVYNHFTSKSGLLEALAWSLFATADIERVRKARHHPEPDVALRSFVVENMRFLAKISAEGRSVLAAAVGDPDLDGVINATYIAGRRAAIHELVERLERAARLRPGWPSERAVAALMVLTSLESFETLVARSGQTVDEAGTLIADMATLMLRD